MTTRIYSGPLSMFGAKAEIAAREKGVDFELVMVPFTADRKGAGMTGATPRLIDWRTRVGERAALRAVVDPMMRFLASQGRGVPPFLQR